MAKPSLSLSERVALRELRKKPTQGGQNRAAFLALREDIRDTLKDGWSVKSIWETLHDEGKITFSYQAFCVYVNRLILQIPNDPPAAQHSQPTQSIQKTNVVKKAPGSTGFVFNSQPEKEDLI